MENQATKCAVAVAAPAPLLLRQEPQSETLETIIALAESAFAGEATEVFRNGPFVEVEVVSGTRIVEAVYDIETGALQMCHATAESRRGKRNARALGRAVLSLLDAIDLAKAAVGAGEVLRAALLSAASLGERRFDVRLRTRGGDVDVAIDPTTGRLVRAVSG
jgi:hypothetical protein